MTVESTDVTTLTVDEHGAERDLRISAERNLTSTPPSPLGIPVHATTYPGFGTADARTSTPPALSVETTPESPTENTASVEAGAPAAVAAVIGATVTAVRSSSSALRGRCGQEYGARVGRGIAAVLEHLGVDQCRRRTGNRNACQ